MSTPERPDRGDAPRADHEEQQVVSLCERFGYGRVMQIASEAWAKKDPVGALIVGTCRGLLPCKECGQSLSGDAPRERRRERPRGERRREKAECRRWSPDASGQKCVVCDRGRFAHQGESRSGTDRRRSPEDAKAVRYEDGNPHESHQWIGNGGMASGSEPQAAPWVCGHCGYDIEDDEALEPCRSPEDVESARCRCEWLHPVDGSVDARWPAELDPACPIHAAVDVRGADVVEVLAPDSDDAIEWVRERLRETAALRSPGRAYVFDPSDPWVERAERFIQSREKVSKRTGREIKDKGAVNIMRGLLAALRSPKPAAEPVAWMVLFLEVDGEWEHDGLYEHAEDAEAVRDRYLSCIDGDARVVPLYAHPPSAEPATGRDRSQGVTEQEVPSAGGEPRYTLAEVADMLEAEVVRRARDGEPYGSAPKYAALWLRSGGAGRA